MTEIALALAMMQALPAHSPDSASRTSVRTRTIGSATRAEQLVLRGPQDNRDIRLVVPLSARARPGVVDMAFTFIGPMVPGANVQFRVNGARRGLVERREALADGRAHIVVPLATRDLASGVVVLSVEARLPLGNDQCSDAEQSHSLVKIDPASTFSLNLDAAGVTGRQYVVDGLAEQISVSVADRALTAPELDTAILAATYLARQGHIVHFIRGGARTLISSIQADVSPGDVLGTIQLQASPRAINPPLPELGVSEMGRSFARATTWIVPLDLRALPAGRIPDRIVLKMVVAPDQLDDIVNLRVYLNDFLLRPVDLLGDGTRRTIRLTLPPDELNIYNEIRLVAERANATISSCTSEPVSFPAQLQQDSYLVTASAPGRPRQFATFVGALPEEFDLFIPASDASQADEILPMLLAAQRSFWGPHRKPHVRYYAAGTQPPVGAPSIIVQPSEGNETVVRLIRLNGNPAMTIKPALHNALLPDVPDTYVNTDSIAFDASGIGRGARIVAARDNTGTVDAVRFALEYRLWVVLATLLTLSGIFALYARTRRPTRPSRP